MHKIKQVLKDFIFGPDVEYYCREGASCVNYGRENTFTYSEPFICEDCEDVRRDLELEEQEKLSVAS